MDQGGGLDVNIFEHHRPCLHLRTGAAGLKTPRGAEAGVQGESLQSAEWRDSVAAHGLGSHTLLCRGESGTLVASRGGLAWLTRCQTSEEMTDSFNRT